ncbi:hypothetical protein HP439_04515 [Sphingobacterium shayense]|uniref:hypothetical protein n=1 Tax=Sphingobacterium shayense TaxID=626343 RepID=UPI001553B470|nr:hypothetical protein [Sphingobacterium shayense]NQD69984.1 hypothetical protein [Sphingobacterium shayense]
MTTLLGKYLDDKGVVKSKVGQLARIKKPRLNDLCNKETAKLSPEEFYRIILAIIELTNADDSEFENAINNIFPERIKTNLLESSSQLPNEIQFLKKYMLKQSDVENMIGMAEGKISRLASKKVKDLLAIEIIRFIEGMGLEVSNTFREIYKEIKLDANGTT